MQELLSRAQRMANSNVDPQVAATLIALGVRLGDVVSNMNRMMMGLDRHPDLMAELQQGVVDAVDEAE